MKTALQQILLSTLEAQLPSMKAVQQTVTKPAGGWLRAVRQALGQSQTSVAKQAGITQQAHASFEQGEAKGTLSVGNLERMAAAMDCELVYFLVPREGQAPSFRELAQLSDPNFAHLQATEHSMALEGQAIGDLPLPPTSNKR